MSLDISDFPYFYLNGINPLISKTGYPKTGVRVILSTQDNTADGVFPKPIFLSKQQT